MDDPLAVERAELLRMIEELERHYAGLQDVKAGVSSFSMTDLVALRTRVEASKSPTELNKAWKVAETILRVLASELIKRWFDTFNYLLAATSARSCTYDCWRINQVLTESRWANAA
jgi:hypothetical protein